MITVFLNEKRSRKKVFSNREKKLGGEDNRRGSELILQGSVSKRELKEIPAK